MIRGINTSEFWVTLGNAIATLAVALGFGPDVSDAIRVVAAAAGSIAVAVYTIARTVLKVRVGELEREF